MPDRSPIPDTPAVGLATKLGVVVGALATLLAALAPVLDGDQTPETLGGLGLAALAFYAVIRGRSDQAAAITLAKGQAIAAGVQSSPLVEVPPARVARGAVQPLYYATEPATPNEPQRDADALEEVAAEELAETDTDDAERIPPDTGNPDVGHEDAPPAPVTPDGPNAVRAEG